MNKKAPVLRNCGIPSCEILEHRGGNYSKGNSGSLKVYHVPGPGLSSSKQSSHPVRTTTPWSIVVITTLQMRNWREWQLVSDEERPLVSLPMWSHWNTSEGSKDVSSYMMDQYRAGSCPGERESNPLFVNACVRDFLPITLILMFR